MTLTVGSLFSGIGGFDLGLERAGMTVRWQVENDPYCNRVLARHWPDVPRFGDIKTLSGDELEPVDVVCGGFPCQPVSLAGRRRGADDARWLWPEFARILRVVRPRYALIENVPGLFVRGFDTVLGDLAALGFDADWTTVRASDVGAPHRRERLFVVAYAGGARRRQDARVPHGDEGSDAGRGAAATPGPTERGDPISDAQVQPIGAGLRAAAAGGERWGRSGDPDWWAVEPDVGRVAHGVPARVDRLRGLGNAIVPQVAEVIGRWLIQMEVSS